MCNQGQERLTVLRYLSLLPTPQQTKHNSVFGDSGWSYHKEHSPVLRGTILPIPCVQVRPGYDPVHVPVLLKAYKAVGWTTRNERLPVLEGVRPKSCPGTVTCDSLSRCYFMYDLCP